jgi:glycosyltransferase involved in cell wall biosynthesis
MRETTPKPGVTIAIPFFNNAATLELSIRSLLNQSCSDFELLLCDDGSYDHALATRLSECIDRARDPTWPKWMPTISPIRRAGCGRTQRRYPLCPSEERYA